MAINIKKNKKKRDTMLIFLELKHRGENLSKGYRTWKILYVEFYLFFILILFDNLTFILIICIFYDALVIVNKIDLYKENKDNYLTINNGTYLLVINDLHTPSAPSLSPNRYSLSLLSFLFSVEREKNNW